MIRWLTSNLGLPTADCKTYLRPSAWPVPPGVLYAACKEPSNAAACLQLASDALARDALPYWGMPVPNLYEQELISWLLRYAWYQPSSLDACTITLENYGWIYDAQTVSGVEGQHLKQTYPISFETWLKNAPAGVVLAERRVRLNATGTGYEWDVRNAKFFAPLPDPDLEDFVPPLVSNYVAANMRSYLAAAKALLLGAEGKLSDVRDWFGVYSPNLSNAPTEWGNP